MPVVRRKRVGIAECFALDTSVFHMHLCWRAQRSPSAAGAQDLTQASRQLQAVVRLLLLALLREPPKERTCLRRSARPVQQPLSSSSAPRFCSVEPWVLTDKYLCQAPILPSM
jgi:hypothetical protein